MKILVTGSKGQLGSELKKTSLIKKKFDWFFTDRLSLDFSDLDKINIFLDQYNPNIIVNCAAYTAVDEAEDHFAIADKINHKAISIIAKWCKDNNCKLLHISTDYVYNGNSISPYKEDDLTDPLNNYGKTKLLGEIACQKYNPSSIIIRTSWLYNCYGNNFLTKMINVMHNSDEIMVVDDQFGSPTYAGDLANIILHIICANKWHPGIYNFTNNGKVSWYNFAKEIKQICNFNIIIRPVSSENYSQKARRPKYSLLDNSKIINTFNIKQIDYLYSLRKCVKIIENES